jgi:DnaK suppressor protein
MTAKELAHLRGVLETKRAESASLLGKREVIAVNLSADTLDQTQHAAERDMAVGQLERESTRLDEVRAALRRIDLGTFGICLDCEGEISMKRLTAVPWTTSCITCREAADRNPMLNPRALDQPLQDAA